MSKKIRVAVIFGGRSGEHEVSIISAKNVIEAMDLEKYDVVPVGITKEGKWLTGEKAIKAFKESDYSGLNEVSVNTTAGANELIHFTDGHYEKIHVDIFMPILHGPYGEDGTIQGLFDMANVPYTGCGCLASSVGMDKLISKALWEQAGLPVIPYVGVTKNAWKSDPEEVVNRVESELGFPIFVKPSNMGSSVGISKVKSAKELPAAMDLAAEFDHRILIEKGLNIRELECAVLGNENPKIARVGEVLVGGEFYDYKDKYVDGISKTQVPADIPPRLEKEIQDMAVKAYRVLDCSGLARVDAFFDKKTKEIYLNEINTLPGFTAISMYPKMWEASGLPYPKLIDRIIELGFERFKEQNEKKVSFEDAGDWFK
ncbi:D-alanine--D-alanine ligase family protein [Patescibacteria group bacterium]